VIELEDALRTLPDAVDVAPRGDLATSVRRLHVRRAWRRRSGIAAVTVGATALAAVPGFVASRRDVIASVASASASEAVASLDIQLAALAEAPGADQPRSTSGFAYTHTRGIEISTVTAAGAGEVVPWENSAAGRWPPADSVTFGSVFDREIWLDPSGRGHLTAKPTRVVYFQAGDEQKLASMAALVSRAIDEDLQKGDAANVTSPNVSFNSADLPVQPHAMLAHLRTRAGDRQPETEAIFTAGTDLLRDHVLPLNLRVAIYRALLRLPGIAVAENVADFDGRVGVAVGLAGTRNTLRQLIIEPVTGRQLGERSSLTAATELGPVGTVIGHTAIVESGFVANVKERPAAANR
jgi:hypothetical protein